MAKQVCASCAFSKRRSNRSKKKGTSNCLAQTSPRPSPDVRAEREMLRHTLATLAYRGAKAVRNAPASFASFKASPTTRTPAQILAHIGDLMDWALSIAKGKETWHNSRPKAWKQEVKRFHAALARFDRYLASKGKLSASCERIFQGPIADALTHVGQIAMLRRMAGEPIKDENYSRAKIEAGRVGAKQEKPKREFD